ncbi:MAG: histidinol dehydrogenase, partial [Dehalococcoidia bacterium]|nr:histidinol dehydrogenase [Dehalococcoidia bacterium]
MLTRQPLAELYSVSPAVKQRLREIFGTEIEPESAVRQIIGDVRQRGDAALVDYTFRIDGVNLTSLEITKEQVSSACREVSSELVSALKLAAERIRYFHSVQKDNICHELTGEGLGQLIRPLDRVGLYVPGGKASYPSSVLMNAVPAKVAGVSEIIMVVPTPDGEVSDMVLGAAAIVGVDRVFAVGGAQAVAALAYGTQTIPQVDKIVGPGNIYVATAKGMVFGTVGIDMIAGPSEILVVCDGQTDPDWVAMDLFSQAEHDEDAQSILVSPDAAFLDKVQASIERLLPEMERADLIRHSLGARGAMIQVMDLDEAVKVVNHVAPEHLELSVDDPQALAENIRHAGAIFMGRYTAEAVGDYCA